MKVGILGTGDVGKTLGKAFLKLGHQARMGSRDAANPKATEWAEGAGEGASSGSFADAAAYGDLLVLAISGSGVMNAIKLAGPENFSGKTVIDATNPLEFPPNSPPGLSVGRTDSAGEQIQRAIPEAKVVKAFNIVGNAHMIDPEFPGGTPDMFICGNDAGAKAQVTDILTGLGWPAIDIGGIEGSRTLEPLALLWIVYGFGAGSWDHAFKLLKK